VARGLQRRERIRVPGNYVFSPWGENLQYNYFVSGESASYGYAQSNYEDFITSSDPDSWYDELRSEGRFVVTHDIDGNYSDSSTQAMLHDRLGSRGNGTSGAGHYRALHISDDRDRAAFELVPGARMTGGGPANKTVTIETPVEIDGEEFTYERQVETNRYGDYGVTVPYADDYETAGETRTVTADDVENGANLGSARAHWTFDEGAVVRRSGTRSAARKRRSTVPSGSTASTAPRCSSTGTDRLSSRTIGHRELLTARSSLCRSG